MEELAGYTFLFLAFWVGLAFVLHSYLLALFVIVGIIYLIWSLTD